MSTALDKFQRLEASGLWRDTPDAQRREVIVSLGDATLVVSDSNDRALTHWSLPAVRRLNPGERPAIFYPDGDPGETLEISDTDGDAIDAIEQLRKAVARPGPASGRLRRAVLAGTALTMGGLGIFWLPGAVADHALKVVPDVTRQSIGRQMQTLASRLTGQPCTSTFAQPALHALAARLGVRDIIIVPDGVRDAVALPGGYVLLGRNAVEDFEEPDVAAGYVVAALYGSPDPLARVLDSGGIAASLRLLTTGALTEAQLTRHVEDLLTAPTDVQVDTGLVTAFEQKRVRLKPYALARDPSGETTLTLIEAAPFTELPEPVLSDDRWVALQGICGG